MSDDPAVKDSAFRIHHTMLPVADLDRSIDFYTRLLGMRMMGGRTDEVRKVKVSHVGYGDRDTQPSIELTQSLDPGAGARVRPMGGHIAIHLSGLRGLCAALERERARFKQPLKEGGPGGNSLIAWVEDPDGHELELVERRPA